MRYSKRKGNFSVNTDHKLLNVDFIHGFLTTTDWAKGRSREAVEKTIQNSLCFGLYESEKQIGFARVVTDYSLFAYLFDVFVDPGYRGKGLGKWMMESVLDHPQLMDAHWILRSTDAHELYRKLGFQNIASPQHILEKKPAPVSSTIKWE